MSNISNFDRILKTECNLQHFTKNCRIKNLDDFEREGERKCTEERNGHMLHYEQVLGNVLERTESKCCGVLMKHRHKVKGEQVITLQMPPQLKAKNINLAPGQEFSCQCRAKFLLETESLY